MENICKNKYKICFFIFIERLILFDLWFLIKVRKFMKPLVPSIIRTIKIFLYMIFIFELFFVFAYFARTEVYIGSVREFLNANIKFKDNVHLQINDNSKINPIKLRQELIQIKVEAMQLKKSLNRMHFHFRNLYLNQRDMGSSLADFASEAAGGIVISTPDTQSYQESNSVQMFVFGLPIWKSIRHTPRKVIQPWTEPGECWAFQGSYGKIEIELAYTIFIDCVTVEHILPSASLTGKIDSAPKSFNVLGKINNTYAVIDKFMYKNIGISSQTFEITNLKVKKIPIKRVLLEILSNWGNANYTCIYRFKVHGQIYDFNRVININIQ